MILEGATAFEKGIDFITFFSGKQFTLKEIQDRYHVSYRQAQRLKGQVARIVGIKPAGFGRNSKGTGPEPFLWEIGSGDRRYEGNI